MVRQPGKAIVHRGGYMSDSGATRGVLDVSPAPRHDLAGWLVENALAVELALSTDELHQVVDDALSALDNVSHAHDTREAIDSLLTLARRRLERLRDRHDGDDNPRPMVQGVLIAIEKAERRGEALERLGQHCLTLFAADAVAIVREQPASILRSWVRDPRDDVLADLKVIRQDVSAAWRQLDTSDPAAAPAPESLAAQPNVLRAGVTLSARGERLALLIYYHRENPADTSAEAECLGQAGRALRESRHFQSILQPDVPGHSFLDALSDVTQAAASTHDLGSLYEAVRQALANVLPLDAMLIAMVPPGEDAGIAVYRNERATSYLERVPLSPPFQASIRDGRPFVIADVPTPSSTALHWIGDSSMHVRSLAGAPLMTQDVVSGLIVVQCYEPHAYTPQHADMLFAVGNSIAAALERAELLDQLRTRSIRETALRTVTERLTTTSDARTMLDIVVAEISPVLGDAFVCALSLDNTVTPAGVTMSHAGPEMLGASLGIDADGRPMENGPLQRAYESREPITETDGQHTVAVWPLLADAEPLGALAVAWPSEAFDQDGLTMLATLGETLASSLGSSRLYADRARQEHDLLEVQRVSSLVVSSLDTETVLEDIVTSLPGLFASDGCSVCVIDGNELVPLAMHGEVIDPSALVEPVGASLSETMIREKRVIAIADLWEHPVAGDHARRIGEKARGWAGAPMIDPEGEVIGILAIHSDRPRTWTERDRVLLQTLAGSITVAIMNAWRFSRTRDVLMASIESLANAVDAKDPTTLNHSRNVSDYARQIATAMGCSEQDIDTIALAGLLHDIGKIGIPDRILQKPDTLDRCEWQRIRKHPEIGEQILSGNPHLSPVLPFVRHHHENWDGSGYPDGLEGDEIPLGAAIVALADAVDTMATDRPYRSALSWEQVCNNVRVASGSQFRPDVARAFLDGATAGKITRRTSKPVTLAHPRVQHGAARGHSLDARALMIFHGVAREIRALTDLDTFVANITQILRSVLELANIHIFLIDDSSQEIVHRVSSDERRAGWREVRHKLGEGVVGWVVQHGTPALVPNVAADDRFIGHPQLTTRSELAVPLMVDGVAIGVINAESPRIAAFSDSDQQLLMTAATHIAQTIQVARLHDRFKQMATTDALTGLANHRTFYERLDEEIRHASVTGGVLTVAIMDVDRLKEINDTFGHLAGDAMLREIAVTLKERCRRSDVVARYGGDEFAFILADTDLDGARQAIQNLIDSLRTRSIVVGGDRLPMPTGAWGMAAYPDDGLRSAELVRVADLRMYARKHYQHVGREAEPDGSVVA